MAINKIIYGSETLLDLTGDTVDESTLLAGATAHDKSGTVITGACTFDVDSTDATVSVAEMLVGKTAYARGAKITGTMPNNAGVTGTISTKTGSYSIPQGYHDGSGKVTLTNVETLLPSNVKAGITILGVRGEYSGASISAESKTVTPTKDGFTVQPTTADYLSSVVVNPIPYVESANSAGGTTVTIG